MTVVGISSSPGCWFHRRHHDFPFPHFLFFDLLYLTLLFWPMKKDRFDRPLQSLNSASSVSVQTNIFAWFQIIVDIVPMLRVLCR